MNDNSTPDGTRRQSFDLLFTRRFGTFWFASLLSNIGTWAQQVAQPWLMLNIGASPFLIGLDAFALGAPVLLLTLIGGAMADRSDRRFIITFFQSIQMMCPVLLVVLLLLGKVQPWMVIVLSLVVGVTDALSMPSFQSIVPSLVERRQITQGLTLNSTQFNLSRILGPALAGMLIVSVGAIGCFAVSALSYLPFIGIALWILPRRTQTPSSDEEFNARQLFSRVHEVIANPLVRGALLTVLTSSLLCGPLITFCPLLVKDVLHGDASQYSGAVAAFGIGGLIGAVSLLTVWQNMGLRRLSTGFACCYGVVVVLAAFNPWYWALTALLVLAGLSMNASNTSANSLLQTVTDPKLRGQSVSLYMLVMRGGLSIGSLLTGLLVHWLGIQQALAINGLLAVAIHLVIGRQWLRIPRPSLDIPPS